MLDTTSQLLRGAEACWFPMNTRCPNKCSFCYESKIDKLLPNTQKIHLPRYNKDRFDLFIKTFRSLLQNNPNKKRKVVYGFTKVGDQICYLPYCDFFSLGLSSQQIEILIQHNLISVVYTTGLHVDVDLLKYLSRKYPNKFRVFLSIVTFDPILREKLMNASIDLDKLRDTFDDLVSPTYMLMCLNKEQIKSDLEKINYYSIKKNGAIYISKLYYNKLDSPSLASLANNAEKEFKSIIYHLKSNDSKYGNISKRLCFSPKSEIYAYKWRKHIIDLLQVCKGVKTEAIFCSQGAYSMIRNHLKDTGINIVSLKNCFGGCVDLTAGITINSVLNAMTELLAAGTNLKRIYIPSTFFLIDNKYDFEGNTVDKIRQTYPDIEVIIIDIPSNITCSVLTLDECLNYYENTSE